MKWCKGCNQWKPLASFYRHKATRDGFRPTCKLCVKNQQAANRKRRAEHYRAYDRTRYVESAERREYIGDFRRFKRFRKRMAARRAG